MEYVIILFWMIWFVFSYQRDIKIGNKFILVAMAIMASFLYFGIVYGVTYLVTLGLSKLGVTIHRWILGIIISLIIVICSFLDYKFNDKDEDKEDKK